MAPDAVVVDASVAIKWVVREDDSERAVRLGETSALLAPDLLLVECGNALWAKSRRGLLTPKEADAALALLARTPVQLTPDRELAEAAYRLSAALDHPIHDCVYLALAARHHATVVTADRRFAALDVRPADRSLRVAALSALDP